jgi:hypothetical protein
MKTNLTPSSKPTTVTRKTRILPSVALALAVGGPLAVGLVARAEPAPPPGAPATAVPTNCKVAGSGKCCDPAVAMHLPKEAIFSACSESPATFQGEKGSKETCRYVFKNDKGEEGFVEVYAPVTKEVPDAPNDPFFAYKKIGKVFVTDRALSPKSAPMLAAATGLWMPGAGFSVSVNASTKVCTKAEAIRLAKSLH